MTSYLLKLNVTEPLDHNYGLPEEDITSAAVHPPVLSLKLENVNYQGYPHEISVDASSNDPNVGATVQDVLRTIHKDLGVPICGRDRLQILPKGSSGDSVWLPTSTLPSTASVSYH